MLTKMHDESYKNSMTSQVGAPRLPPCGGPKFITASSGPEETNGTEPKKRQKNVLITVCVPSCVPTQKYNRHPLTSIRYVPVC